MKKVLLVSVCLSLVCGGCSAPSPHADEDVIVFRAMIRYLRARSSANRKLPCFESRMLRRNASGSPLVKADEVYAFIEDDFQKVMNQCSDDKPLYTEDIIRYKFYQPSIHIDSAAIDVDYYCGSLCGRGLTYQLHRNDNNTDWRVTSVQQRWIS